MIELTQFIHQICSAKNFNVAQIKKYLEIHMVFNIPEIEESGCSNTLHIYIKNKNGVHFHKELTVY